MPLGFSTGSNIEYLPPFLHQSEDASNIIYLFILLWSLDEEGLHFVVQHGRHRTHKHLLKENCFLTDFSNIILYIFRLQKVKTIDVYKRLTLHWQSISFFTLQEFIEISSIDPDQITTMFLCFNGRVLFLGLVLWYCTSCGLKRKFVDEEAIVNLAVSDLVIYVSLCQSCSVSQCFEPCFINVLWYSTRIV